MDEALLDSITLDLGGGSEIALALILALMMFAVALGLRAEHFKYLKDNPKVYFSGVLAQIIGLPALTVLICFIVGPPASVALGMILIACCPGGNVSNLLALFGRANTALSVSLTATSSLAAAFITPISILLWSGLYPPTRDLFTEINLDTVSFLRNSLVILALPLLLGMMIAHFAPKLSERLQKPLSVIAGLGLLVIIIGACVQYLPVIPKLGPAIFILVIAHNGLAFLIGAIAGVLSGADKRARRALTFEVGIQNSGLGIVILLTQLGGLGGAGVVAGLWGTWHIIAGLVLVAIFRRNDKKGNSAHV